MFQQRGQPLSYKLQALLRYLRVVTGEEIITKRLWI